MNYRNVTFIVEKDTKIHIGKNYMDNVPTTRKLNEYYGGCYYMLYQGDKFSYDDGNGYDVTWFMTENGIRFKMDCGAVSDALKHLNASIVNEKLIIDKSIATSRIRYTTNMFEVHYSTDNYSNTQVSNIKVEDLKKDINVIKTVPFFNKLNSDQVDDIFIVAKKYLSSPIDKSVFDDSLRGNKQLPSIASRPYHYGVKLDENSYDDIHKNIFDFLLITRRGGNNPYRYSKKERKELIERVLKINFLPYSMYTKKQRKETIDYIFNDIR